CMAEPQALTSRNHVANHWPAAREDRSPLGYDAWRGSHRHGAGRTAIRASCGNSHRAVAAGAGPAEQSSGGAGYGEGDDRFGTGVGCTEGRAREASFDCVYRRGMASRRVAAPRRRWPEAATGRGRPALRRGASFLGAMPAAFGGSAWYQGG